jgi:hypothetical protein
MSSVQSSVSTAVKAKQSKGTKAVKAKGGKKQTVKAAEQTQQSDRRYGHDKATAKELRAEKAYNGYREGSSYWTVVEALHSLGVGKFHSAEKLLTAYQAEADKSALKAFKAKENRNAETGLDWKARIIQNAYVTTRSDYGKRMRDIGYEVRAQRTDKGEQTFGLFRMGK